MDASQKGRDSREEALAAPDRGTVLIVEDDVLQARALERVGPWSKAGQLRAIDVRNLTFASRAR